MAKYKKQDIIEMIIKMRIEKMCSSRTIIKSFLQDELGYKKSYSYELYREAWPRIKEYWNKENEVAFEEAIGQLEELLEIAKANKDYKQAYQYRKEMNEMMGLYVDKKVNISGDRSLLIPTKIITEIIHKNGEE